MNETGRKGRRRFAVLAAIAGLAFVIGASKGGGGGQEGSGASRVVAVEELDLRKQVGQVLISRFEGSSAPGYIRDRLKAGETAGVILFGENVGSHGVRRLSAELQAAAGGSALIATDDEGGTIMNVPTTPPLPAQPDIGTDAEKATRQAGRDLRDQGVNVNLAPVADLAVPGSVMAGRAFGAVPEDVGAKVAASVQGYRDAKVAATAKHFPGLGPAVENTDDAPVTVLGTRTDLEDDLLPFRAAIDERVPLMMVSHARYPAIDKRRIASQSPTVIEQLLRTGLGYRGVVITDSIEAEAALRRSSVEVAAERSIEAGADLVLMTGRGSWVRVYPRLLARAERDAVFRDRVGEAAKRVLTLKYALGLSPGTSG